MNCMSCMILSVEKLHYKTQVSTVLQCTRELENGYQRGAKTNNFLLGASHAPSRNMVSSFWTVTQSASSVPLPWDGKTCCRCQLITKKMRWCETWIRLLVPEITIARAVTVPCRWVETSDWLQRQSQSPPLSQTLTPDTLAPLTPAQAEPDSIESDERSEYESNSEEKTKRLKKI